MKLKELFSDPDKWTKGANARDLLGRVTGPNDEDAAKFCLQGGVFKCYGDNGASHEILNRLTLKIYDRTKLVTITSWNDQPKTSHAEVLALVTDLDV